MQTAVLITGANGGIGRAICQRFRDGGWYVIGLDVSFGAAPACDRCISLDLIELTASDSRRLQFLREVELMLAAENLKLTALVNNAAEQVLGGVASLSPEQLRQSLDVNVVAPFVLSQLLFPLLESGFGSIVNIGSIHSHLTKPGFVGYATSKAALAGLTRAMAVDVGSRIRINCIEPAAIATDMLKAGFSSAPAKLKDLASHHPSNRIGTPEEVATLALTLAGPDLEFVNGAVWSIDGAISARLHDPD